MWAVVLASRHLLCSQVAAMLATFFGRYVPCRSLLVAMLGRGTTRYAQTCTTLFPAHCSVALCVAPRCPLYNEITFAVHNASKSNSKKETGTVRETAESPAEGRPLCEDCLSAVRV